MRLQTLGTGTVALAATRVCAGHLVHAGSVSLLLDCGSGVTHRLAEHGIDWMSITHVALTHFHADHVGDLPTLVFAWKYGALPARSAPLVIIGPAGTAALLDRLAAAFGVWVTTPGFPMEVREVAPGESLALQDGVTLTAQKVPHTDESVAYSVRRGAGRVVYTGDTSFDVALGEWAKGCDVLLCECSLPTEMAVATHLTPEQVGALAAIAAPRLLALTHLYPPVERVDIRALIAAQFTGSVTIAEDGWTTEIEEG